MQVEISTYYWPHTLRYRGLSTVYTVCCYGFTISWDASLLVISPFLISSMIDVDRCKSHRECCAPWPESPLGSSVLWPSDLLSCVSFPHIQWHCLSSNRGVSWAQMKRNTAWAHHIQGHQEVWMSWDAMESCPVFYAQTGEGFANNKHEPCVLEWGASLGLSYILLKL